MENKIIEKRVRAVTLRHLRFLKVIDKIFDSLIALVEIKNMALLNEEQETFVKNYHYFIRKNTLYKNFIECVIDEEVIIIIIKHLSKLEMLRTKDYAYLDQLIENTIPNEEMFQSEDLIRKLQRTKEYFKNVLGYLQSSLKPKELFYILDAMYYDSHTHLNDEKLTPQRNDIVENFINVGGKGLVTIGTNLNNSELGCTIVQQAKKKFHDFFLKSTIGLHPSVITYEGMTKPDFPQALQDLKRLYQQYTSEIVAIGEIGTDLHTPGTDHTLHDQKELFALQCDLAQELNLPIIIHSRDDFAGTRDILQNYTTLKIYFHCRGYEADKVTFLQHHCPQLWIGMCGNVTYPKAQMLRDSLQKIGSDQLLLETDAPYLAPQGLRGTINESKNLVSIYEFVAFELEKPLQILQSQAQQNFQILYQG